MIERSQDYRRIMRLVDWQPAITIKAFYLVASEAGEDVGLWMLEPYFAGLKIHADMGPKCRGRKAVESAKEALKWVFKNTDHETVFADIPAENKAACRIAAWAGLEYTGLETDRRIFEIHKPKGPEHDK